MFPLAEDKYSGKTVIGTFFILHPCPASDLRLLAMLISLHPTLGLLHENQVSTWACSSWLEVEKGILEPGMAESDCENSRTLEKEQKEVAEKGFWGQGDLKMEKCSEAEVCVTFNCFNG